MKEKYINASDIGKTAYCPHSHYLSTKHGPTKETKKRLKQGIKKHERLDKQASKPSAFRYSYIISLLIIALIYYFSRN
jgi:CRISPR/Cas system-associated exonuclease Cas4 (RecB family)